MFFDCRLQRRDRSRLIRGPEECDEEENTQQHIDPAKYEIRRMQSALQVEHKKGCAITKLLHHRWDHHRPEADRVAGDEKEDDLKCEPYADETVIEAGMSDGRRILAPDRVKHKIERREDQKAPDAGNPENNPGEFHVIVLRHSADKSVRPTQT